MDPVDSVQGLPKFSSSGKSGPLPMGVYPNKAWFKADNV